MSDRQLGGERSPTFGRLLIAVALTCLLPVVALGLVGSATDDGDDVSTADQAADTASDIGAWSLPATTAPTTTATPPPPATTAPASTTTTTPAPTTTATPPSPATTAPAPSPATTAAPAPTATITAVQAAVDQVVELVNQERAAANPACDPLIVDDHLAAAAQAHSDDMAAHDYFSHTSLDGATPQDRAEAAGYTGLVGENIAAGQQTAQDVMAAWMASDGHRDNILNCDYVVIGVGLNEDGWYWTQMFGMPS